MAKKETPSVEMKTYVLEIGSNRRLKKVTVPASWKITYGFACPGSNVRGPENPYVLRFYEGNKENLRALFDDVRSVRDSSIKIEEQVIKTKTEAFYRDTPGGRKVAQAEMKVKEWRDPDDPEDAAEADREFLQLPCHSEEEE